MTRSRRIDADPIALRTDSQHELAVSALPAVNNPPHDGIIAGFPPLAACRSLSPAIELEAWHRVPAHSGQHDKKKRQMLSRQRTLTLPPTFFFFFFSISPRDTSRMPCHCTWSAVCKCDPWGRCLGLSLRVAQYTTRPPSRFRALALTVEPSAGAVTVTHPCPNCLHFLTAGSSAAIPRP